MATPEIIGSIRSTYTRAVCMVCEEKGVEYVLTERPLHAPEIFAIHPFGKDFRRVQRPAPSARTLLPSPRRPCIRRACTSTVWIR